MYHVLFEQFLHNDKDCMVLMSEDLLNGDSSILTKVTSGL